jgi:class 3 adenylate cyclase
MVTFETPAAGAACAAAMQRVVAQHNEAHPELELGLRVGVHAGEAIDGGGDVFGIPVVIAKRLCDQCVGGQVLVSSVLRERAGGEYVELGVLTLKGLCEPVAVAELDWRAADDGLALAGQGCGSQITTGISRSVHVA